MGARRVRDPEGQEWESSGEAALHHGKTRDTISRWCREERYGWSYASKASSGRRVAVVLEDGSTVVYPSLHAMARKYDVSPSRIREALHRGRLYKCMGSLRVYAPDG